MLADAALSNLIRQNNTTRGNVKILSYINSKVQDVNGLNQHTVVYKKMSQKSAVFQQTGSG